MRRQLMMHGDLIALAGLIIAWLGIWTPWIPASAAALTQNGPYLAEWAAFLLDVRFGPLTHTPDLLRLAFTLGGMALSVSAGIAERAWVRWALRGLVFILALVLMPPYPQILDVWRSEVYGLRFLIASCALIAIPGGALTDSFSETARRGLIMGLSLAALLIGWFSYVALRAPFEAHYDRNISAGLGSFLFVLGLLLAVIGSAATFVKARQGMAHSS